MLRQRQRPNPLAGRHEDRVAERGGYGRDARFTRLLKQVLEGQPVSRYLGVVTGEAIIGANIFRDMFATVRDVVGGRSATSTWSTTGRARSSA